MPSPCEVVTEQEEAVIHYGEGEFAPRRSATRVIPAVVGGLFAGLLLVGLGCTPLFKPQAAKAKPESGKIVTASNAAGSVDGLHVVAGAASKAPAREPAAPSATDTSPNAASDISASAMSASSTSSQSVNTSADSHRFAIDCDPPHARADTTAARPETVALQGIMAGQNSKTALLNGVLYHEGDRFGSAVCPWTIAMIDPAGVRIEKTFGDRVCGVTIQLQKADKSHAATPSKQRSGAKSR